MLKAARRMKSNALAVMVAVGGLAFAPVALADMFKCTVGGKVQYQQTPCASGEEKALDDSCRIPDDCIDSNRYPLFMARAVLQELIESLQSSQEVKPC